MNEENPVIKAAKEYLAGSARYTSMTELGKKLGLSSHAVGKKLKAAGLRDPEGCPTERARAGNFVRLVFFQERFAFDVWHEDRTLHVLRSLIELEQSKDA
jgi:hypothetical protein